MSLALNSTLLDQAPQREVESVSTAGSLASLVEQVYTQQYTEARQLYKASHCRFTARVSRLPPSGLEEFCSGAFRDLSFYTSAASAGEMSLDGPRRMGTQSLNQELCLLGQRRLRATRVASKPSAADVVALLVTQEAAEYADLLELEAASFMQVARSYYEQIFGPTDNLIWLEAQARRSFEDEYSRATMSFLAELREELWVAQQRLLLRALGMCPDALPHVAQLRLMAAESYAAQQAKLSVLESRDAVPLWKHVCAIRGETESEEDITFRRLLLACVVEAHCISGGFLRRDTATGLLRRTYKKIPTFMQDAIVYATQFEAFIVVLEEETQRMRIAEEVEEAFALLAATFFSVAGTEGSVSSGVAITAPASSGAADSPAAETR
ncbi:hypothetical protein LSCM1_03328 [Leishmania martiniquensis]|uniref:Uncharacterized protein n=1 Tax=Leishmania martiniquensis TaxID=1580590 RepID=A0A836GGC9_9TRYP|nr:hypothetical protein LSCM1_03328 [Leishmania martiniquensis]